MVPPDGRGPGPAKATRGPVVSRLPHQPGQTLTAQCCTMGTGHRKAGCYCCGSRVRSPLSLPVGKHRARGTWPWKVFWDTGWGGPMLPPFTAAGKALCRHLQERGCKLLALCCHVRLPADFPRSPVPQGHDSVLHLALGCLFVRDGCVPTHGQGGLRGCGCKS